MSRLPIVTAKTLERIPLNLGFEITRQKGSHVFYRHPDGRTTTTPPMGDGISHAPFCEKYSGKSRLPQIVSWKS
jgi:predicted RNA binding protein YcfA (HicA-like mRNA interferase family)